MAEKDVLRILHVTEKLQAAGIESFIMNMYRNINRDIIQFDFFVTRNEKEHYDNEIQELGGKKYTSNISDRINVFFRVLLESFYLSFFLIRHNYEIVHIHATTPLRALYLLAAKIGGVKVRIYHSHSAEISDKSKLKKKVYSLFKPLFSLFGTDYFACSNAAGIWMFSKKNLESGKYRVIYNGIDTDLFSFDLKNRELYRNKLDISNNFVIGHTGRFLEQKNHAFIIDVFEEAVRKIPNAVLLLIGTGPLVENVKKMVNSKGLEDKVYFLGVRQDVNDILQAMDFYIMPSLYEGLPVSAVEAQCAGLPCLFSNNITKEVALNPNIKFLDLNTDLETWVSNIELSSLDRNKGKINVKKNGYDIHDASNLLMSVYTKSN